MEALRLRQKRCRMIQGVQTVRAAAMQENTNNEQISFTKILFLLFLREIFRFAVDGSEISGFIGEA